MDGIALLNRAKEAGLHVVVKDGRLRLKGPRKLASLSRLLIENKAAVIAALEPRVTTDTGLVFRPSVDGPGTKTHGRPQFDEVSGPSDRRVATGHRLIGNGFPPHPVGVVPEGIQSTPKVVCTGCGVGRVLPELRAMTGGRCYACWNKEVGT